MRLEHRGATRCCQVCTAANGLNHHSDGLPRSFRSGETGLSLSQRGAGGIPGGEEAEDNSGGEGEGDAERRTGQFRPMTTKPSAYRAGK
jgi:hypothetical protein